MPASKISKFFLDQQVRRAMKLWKENSVKTRLGIISGPVLTKKKIVLAADGTPKGIIARSIGKLRTHVRELKPAFHEQWVYYPTKEETAQFANVSAKLEKYGPAQDFPGSVGSIGVLKDRQSVTIAYMQSHFKTGGDFLSRSAATKYGGWRRAVLQEVLEGAIAEKKKISLGWGKFTDDAKEDFRELAEENGMKVNIVYAHGNKFSTYEAVPPK